MRVLRCLALKRKEAEKTLLCGQVVGSTVAALRGRVQQMGGGDARAHWPGPGRRSSQYKGVSWSEASAKWRAQCWDGSKVGPETPLKF